MTNDFDFQKKLMQILSWMSAAITGQRLYLSHNPYLAENIDKAYRELLDLMQSKEILTIFLVGEDIVVNRRRLAGVSPAAVKFALIMKNRGIESLSFLPGLQKIEFQEFLRDLSASDLPSIASRNSIKLGKVELKIHQSDDISNAGDSSDPESSEYPSEPGIQQLDSLTGQEPHELKEQYLMIQNEKKIDIREVDQIVIRFINELKRNLCPLNLLSSVKSADEYTYTHLINVGILTMSLAAELGFAGNQLHEIGIAALLHDVGKTFIPDEIISKPGKLSAEERKIIEAHPVKGCLYLMELEEIPRIVVISALEHHIKFDGNGYPAIRQGWKPNIVAQMITIADVFDAMRSRRSYKEPKPLHVVVEILREEKGTTFNPDLVDFFLNIITPDDSKFTEKLPSNRPGKPLVNGQADLQSESLQVSNNSIPETKNPVQTDVHLDNEGELKMDIKTAQVVGPQTAEEGKQTPAADLFHQIVNHAKAKDFEKAEALREKLMEIEPMALNEIITSAEIIEQEKNEGINPDHLTVWADLYRSISKEEGNALYYAMKEASYFSDQPLFSQGDRNTNLYFVNQGQLKMLFRNGGRDILVKTLLPGDILGIDTFFSDSICTCSVSSFSLSKVNYLEKKVLKDWKEKFPTLE